MCGMTTNENNQKAKGGDRYNYDGYKNDTLHEIEYFTSESSKMDMME